MNIAGRELRLPSAGQSWTMAFALWALFLSGALATMVGSPGVLQLFRLRSLHDGKQTHLTQLQEELRHLESQAFQLEKSRVTQQREIRRVLGYAGPDEIIFDFAAPERR